MPPGVRLVALLSDADGAALVDVVEGRLAQASSVP